MKIRLTEDQTATAKVALSLAIIHLKAVEETARLLSPFGGEADAARAVREEIESLAYAQEQITRVTVRY